MSARQKLSAAVLLLVGCSGVYREPSPSCASDDDCGAGLICFAEGCGDPGKGIVVEVAGNGSTNQFAKDVPIPDGTLSPIYDFPIGNPLTIIGEFQRELTARVDPANRSAYVDSVRLQALGVSELIPGVVRSYEQRIDMPVRGTFQMVAGAGIYSLTATPVENSVPPITISGIAVRSGANAPEADFAFPSVEGAVTLSGRLLKKIDSSKVPAVELALTSPGTAMDLQAFDPDTKEPLSQRFHVSSGAEGATGNFIITMNPRAKDLKTISLVATPLDLGAPTKTFVLVAPLPKTVTLELGDPGPVIAAEADGGVAGSAIDFNGQPIANAQVIIEGTVNGGGTFRSKIVTTDATGGFKLDSLAGSMRVTVLPPPESAAAVTTKAFDVPVSTKNGPFTVQCAERTLLSGVVLAPDGTPAPNVLVRAIEHDFNPEAIRPLTLDDVTTTTDALGEFSMRLDSADWRLEFAPGDRFPLASRSVTVFQLLDHNGNIITRQSLKSPVKLAAGHVVQGTITGMIAQKADAPISYATVRFYRVAPLQGTPVATLIGSSVADKDGHYAVVLPTKE